MIRIASLCLLWLGLWQAAASAQPPNTQKETVPLLSPAAALAAMQAPKGFDVSLFAAEPDVQQPIALAFDTRGRLWVAECYTYSEHGKFDEDLRDRIVILEDTDGDGQADKRTVFWDQGQRLTSVEIGFGGVWALCAPNLLFIPDRDGDDRPDGEPVVVLDGWTACGHNLVNGLRWGPDGWLYGRHGILDISRVGPPGTPDEQRTPIDCGIWRYHPQRKTFEVVCSGTTNPWGMDWDDHGELFFINTVIGHLWHVIPGAHFRRMYGQDLRPNLYELVEQTADHVHWDASAEDWTAQRNGVSEGTSTAGGGHAHSGLMIYQGDNWPDEYRGEMFTLNLHGRRINHDHLERDGATYVGKHERDFLTSGDEWFRGIDLAYGPDGGVYILDWSDIGECHENDGLHRTSGRIYKVTWRASGARHGMPKEAPVDVAALSTSELVGLQTHRNEWLVRQARRVLQERAAAGADMTAAHRELWKQFGHETNAGRKLRALWCLYVTGGVEQSNMLSLLDEKNEHLRAWGVRLLVDRDKTDAAVIEAMARLADREQSGLVLTYLASALQRLPSGCRFALAESLADHDEFAADRVLPLMVWYGVEDDVARHPDDALRLISRSKMPKVTRYIARRLTGDIDANPAAVDKLVELASTTDRDELRGEVLLGMAEALRGWSRAPAPHRWAEWAREVLHEPSDPAVAALVRELSVVFGEGLSADEVFAFVADRRQPEESRRQAIHSLAAARTDGLEPVLQKLLDDRAVTDEAVRGLAALDLARYAPLLIDSYGRLDERGKDAVVAVLATRADSAVLLLDAVDRHVVPAEKVGTFVVRQMQLVGDDALIRRIAKTWPDHRPIADDKLQTIQHYRDALDEPTRASADLRNGRRVFQETCGKCHKLFGEGGTIGPELTGAQRGNLDYWLDNMVDPSAAVPDQYKMSVVVLTDGRLLSGLVVEQSKRTLTLQTPTDRLVLQQSAIDEIRPSPLSIMPEGQLEKLSDADLRDLVGYLMSPSVPAK